MDAAGEHIGATTDDYSYVEGTLMVQSGDPGSLNVGVAVQHVRIQSVKMPNRL